jgi:hypothetical protein
MKISGAGILVLLGTLFMAVMPLPRRAEGVRLGFFGAILALVAYDAMKQQRITDAELAAIPAPSPQPGLITIPVRPYDISEIGREPSRPSVRRPVLSTVASFPVLRELRRTSRV